MPSRPTQPTRTVPFGLALAALAVLMMLSASASARTALRPPTDADADPSPCIANATLRLSASPATVVYGQASQLSWSVTLPRNCSGVSVSLAGVRVSQQGSQSVAPSVTTQYHLVVSQTRLGVRSQTSASTQVSVAYPEHVAITTGTQSPAKLLAEAISAGVKQIELGCGVEIDMTGRSQLSLSTQSIVAARGCERSLSRPGPLIYVTDERQNFALFDIRGDTVVLSGFRLRGPTDFRGSGGRKEAAIRIVPFGDHPMIESIEISNMEIYHWSGAGIDVRDAAANNSARGRLVRNPLALRIRNNYIHHNRHDAGYGYGVNVGGGAYALIERNVFNENRHAISGDSHDEHGDYSGYTARENLILSGGGKHCTGNSPYSICWQTHQIDMHGDESTFFGGDHCCGVAGETMLIERNTLLYDAGYAIKIRGNPTDRVVVDGNVFRHSSRSDAIAQNGDTDGNITRPVQVLRNNRYSIADPTGQPGQCDFDGDGRTDDFITTGVTWWARSSAQAQWHYLNTQPQQLPQLELRDMDGDRHCDVILRPDPRHGGTHVPKYSRRGTGPWMYFAEVEH